MPSSDASVESLRRCASLRFRIVSEWAVIGSKSREGDGHFSGTARGPYLVVAGRDLLKSCTTNYTGLAPPNARSATLSLIRQGYSDGWSDCLGLTVFVFGSNSNRFRSSFQMTRSKDPSSVRSTSSAIRAPASTRL
jgi:hypothetical protein